MNPCTLPPPGWRCTRGAGHDGPCAAIEVETVINSPAVAAGVQEGITKLVDELDRERERLDFVIQRSTTWYPGRGQGGWGILCYQYKGSRHEVQGPTMRAALDTAILHTRLQPDSPS